MNYIYRSVHRRRKNDEFNSERNRKTMRRQEPMKRYMFDSAPWTQGQEPVIHQYGFGQFRAHKRRQAGHGPFTSRNRRQRGHGVFSFLGKALGKAVKYIAPVIKKSALRAGRRAVKEAPRILASQNRKKAAKEILKSVGKQALTGIATETFNRANSQRAQKTSVKRRRRKKRT